MPVYASKDLIAFVNELEQQLLAANEAISDWDTNRTRILNTVTKAETSAYQSITALVRSDEALAELNTATFKSTANRGKRLQDTLDQLKNELYLIASQIQGGGGELTDGVFFEELNNAVSSVDITIEDGLKLDYRLREIQSVAAYGQEVLSRKLHMPYKHIVAAPQSAITIPPSDGVTFIEAEVTVLDESGDPILDAKGKIITGNISEDGGVTFSSTPTEKCIIYFPVEMKFADIPEDFLYLFMNQIVQKNSSIMEAVLNTNKSLETIQDEIESMKGVNWTADFSIMRNHKDVVIESITPKGINVEVKDGLAHVMFSYNDHPHLSHFVLERWDEDTKTFVPYDGENGILNK